MNTVGNTCVAPEKGLSFQPISLAVPERQINAIADCAQGACGGMNQCSAVIVAGCYGPEKGDDREQAPPATPEMTAGLDHLCVVYRQ
jgi:hypothetical protein